MLPKKTRHLLYAILLLVLSIVGTSAVAKTKVFDLFTNLPVLGEILTSLPNSGNASEIELKPEISATKGKSTDNLVQSPSTASAVMFATIIANADDVKSCTNDGSSVARFNLCGNFDNRIVVLNQAYSSYEWQQLSGCAFDVNNDCPAYSCGPSNWQTVGTGPTYTLDAAALSSVNGGEFRVRVNGGAYYYFKAKKSSITQTYVKEDFICGNPGRIQITNLSSSYEYSIDSGSGFGPWQGAVFSGLNAGTYVVKTRLINTPSSCEYQYEPITIETKDIDIDVTFVDAQCSGETGSITVKVNNVPGPYKYTLLNSSGQPQEFTSFIASNTNTFAAVGFGTYSVKVETQKCKGDLANGIDPPTEAYDINGNPIIIGNGLVALQASTEVNNSFGCNVTNVDITVKTSGGAPPYRFIVNGAGPSSPSYTTSTTYNVTSPGTYDFLITDANGCTITASADVKELTPPVVSVSGTDGNCTNGGAKLNINVINAKGYNLSFRATPSDPWSNNPQLSVPAGTYNVQVRYQQGTFDCTYNIPGSVTVNTTGVIVGNAVKLADRTCSIGGTVGGSIEFQWPFSGGSGSGYQFSISGNSGFSNQTLYTGLAPGTYTPMIRDSGGCQLVLTDITIGDVNPPSNINFVQSNMSCVLGTSDVELTPTSANPIVKYEVISPVSIDNGGNDTFTGLSINTAYQFRITDDKGCTYTKSFTPANISSIQVREKSGGDLKVCLGANDGSGTFIVDGFANNYTYHINTGSESSPQNNREVNLTGLGAGTYTITVTDADTGCTDSASFVVQEPATAITLGGTVTPMSCANGNQGKVVASASGGWGSYRYTLTEPNGNVKGPKSGQTFGSLSQAGNYTLSVMDVEGCTETFNFTLTPLSAPTIALDTGASEFCYVPGTGATLAVTASGGLPGPGYEYRINGGSWGSSSIFSNLSPGNYNIEVRDANNCKDNLNFEIKPQVRVTVSVDGEIPCGGLPGSLHVDVSGGYSTGPVSKQYEVIRDGSLVDTQPFSLNSFNYSTNVPGVYIIRVTDNQGCQTDSNPLVLNPPMAIAANAEVIPASCGQSDNGIIIITPDATIGVPPYEISFDGGAFGNQTTFSGLNEGQTYTYIVRDSRGCVFNGSETIGPNPNPAPNATVSAVDATCSSNVVSGDINITNVTGGTPDFTYIVQDQFGVEVTRTGPTASTTHTFTGLAPGTYNVVTLDHAGCRDEDTVTIDQTTVTVVPNAVAPTCSATGFSNIVTIVGGTGPFEIRLVEFPVNPFVPVNGPPRSHTFAGLQFGVSYTVEVRDLGTGCTYEDIIDPVDGPTPLDVTAISTVGYCNNSHGQIEYTVSGFTGAFTVEIFNSDTGVRSVIDSQPASAPDPYSNTYEALPGNYQIIVTDADTCTDAAAVTVDQNLPSLDILVQRPANCNSNGEITVRGSGGDGGPYTFAFMPQGVSPIAGDFTPATTFFGPGGDYDIYVKDGTNCASFSIPTTIVMDPALPAPTLDVVNQCDVSAKYFQITASMPETVDTPRFTLGGVTQFGVLNSTITAAHPLPTYDVTFTVNSTGSYPVDVVDANGCTSTGIADVYRFLSASGDFTTQPTCNDPDGVITVTPVGGSGDFTYDLSGTDYSGTSITASVAAVQPVNGIFINMAPGDYQVQVTDNETGCDKIVDIHLEAATPPVIASVADTDITCQGDNDGSINVQVQSGTDVDGPIVYNLLNFDTRALITSNDSGSFNGLSAGRYDVEVVSARDCSGVWGLIEIIEPPLFAITASAPPFDCVPGGANRYSSTIIKVVVDPSNPGTSPGYQYSITGFGNYQTSDEFEIVDDGTDQDITVYAIDGNGCQATFVVPTITRPTTVVPTLTVLSALDCKDPERVRIDVTGTTNFTVNTTSITPVAAVSSGGASFVEIDLPDSGDYLFEVVDNTGGCTYPLPKHHVDEPVKPTVTISEAKPVSCFGTNDGALNITVADYIGVYDYQVFSLDQTGTETLFKSGTFNTTTNPETITVLAGGNYIVRVASQGSPYCSAESNVATVRAPLAALAVTTSEIGNVNCTDDAGKIVANATDGWDQSAYEYQLSKDDGTGNYLEVVPFGAINEFDNLSSGNYRVTVKDIQGCEDTSDITLDPVPPITAGIREPVGLICPDGNNAVLEAYQISTGNPGADGGVPGAGYKYQLLYLGSNDNTDISSTSGLQDVPQFSGATGGFISTGWYAIKIVSGYGCEGVTDPYFVQPPPPLIPNLVQVQAPGCGGQGQMRLSIVNPQPGFTYEYRSVTEVDPAPYTPITGTSVIINGNAGFYQYNVRKTGSTLTCKEIKSPGVTLVDAEIVQLITNLPDDISCYSELDGRIESFADGGVGNYKYTLYEGDPGSDPFNPAASATQVRPAQDYGTFENLPEGYEFYIGVTSGASCGAVQGPFSIKRPDAILFNATSVPVNCNGEGNGSISVEVTSGGVGLIQFAISPNFSEFFSDPANPGKYVFDDLSPGTYEILLQDEKGCSEKQTLTITEPDPLNVTSVQTPETCINAADGTAQLTITGGTPFTAVDGTKYYETSLNSSDDADFVRNDNLFFENLVGGETYVAFIRDANGCTTNVIFPIVIGVDLTAEASPEYGCQGIFPNSTVTVKMKDESIVPQLLFSLDVDDIAQADTQRTFGDLPAGYHTVYIYHENGCATFVEFTIDEYDPLTLSAVKTGPNEITATATGGFGNYEYFFQGNAAGNNNVFTLNEDDNVTVTVRDSKGCEATVTIPFEFTGMVEIPNFFTPDGDNKNDVWAPKNMDYFPNIEVIIYDRYGRVVVRLDQVTSWDGKYDGKELPSGDYWYVVNANDKDKQQYVGHFTLYR